MAKSKMSGVVSAGDYRPTSSMNLEGKHASSGKAHKIGSKIKMVVTATKKRHSMNSDGSHSSSYDINGVTMHQDEKQYSGPNEKAANNDA